ncbi:dTDP-4-dehydrorhamnose reductase [Limnobacter sp. 130]|uniref:dTDP-4-dehydrorhamnose reductase family protein n=1 Tax=Limnobacter sp. 130 TaxID=2653147 RepID=UPI0012F22309|nr:SDR family oxidoreductase [Limnobacter sp. 130]VWX32671.1 dTDP-4-dehydrorhamnose reductase [Limnobacter sp. 130]
MKILVLGITGMLGSAVFKALCESKRHQVWGSQRGRSPHPKLAEFPSAGILTGLDVLDQDSLAQTFAKVKPDVVINCVGLIKQLDQANDPLVALPINSLLPHRLLQLCEVAGARLVHISTDCVFSGRKGNYLETDVSDAEDLYGKSKYIGELHNSPYAITLRTSIIGHELGTSFALLEWFLAQQGSVKGFSKAIFSGVPTCELAEIILDHVIPKPELHGLYHVAAKPIAKLDLLQLVAQAYGLRTQINPDSSLVIDRSLCANRFQQASGYTAPEWPDLIQKMRQSRIQ